MQHLIDAPQSHPNHTPITPQSHPNHTPIIPGERTSTTPLFLSAQDARTALAAATSGAARDAGEGGGGGGGGEGGVGGGSSPPPSLECVWLGEFAERMLTGGLSGDPRAVRLIPSASTVALVNQLAEEGVGAPPEVSRGSLLRKLPEIMDGTGGGSSGLFPG